jgi:hypothetical protein
LSSIVQIDRDEWESFLEKLAEFEKKYNLLLSKIDAIQSGVTAVQQPNTEKRALSAMPLAPSGLMAHPLPKRGLLTRLEEMLRYGTTREANKSKGSNYLQDGAHCSRCGWQLAKATQYCQQCGVGFGRVICPCGRALGRSDRFCDSCGRAV